MQLLMRRYLFLVLFFVSQLPVQGALTEKDIKYLKKDVRIIGTRDYTERTEDRKKIEIFQVSTSQNQDDPSMYRIRIVVELKDKQKDVYIATFTGERSGRPHSEYEGEDYWMLYMPYEDLDGLKVTGYVVQYGIMDGDTFIPLVEDEKHYDEMMAGLETRSTLRFPNKTVLMNYYMYTDEKGSDESSPRKVKDIQ